jgi:site-specific DNA-methyltransferase (adenine-specific)
MRILEGDCLVRLKELAENSVDAIVTDPPYELGFMGKAWDNTGIANSVEMWRECLRVLKPGGHLLSFGGSRTYHRMASAIEDAGFEIRDDISYFYSSDVDKNAFLDSLSLEQQEAFLKAFGKTPMLDWLYGSGFPKSLDVGKAIDKAAGVERATSYVPHNDNQIFGEGKGKARGVDRTPGAVLSEPAVTDAAKQWEGWGTALKPAHEPICMARKPIEGTVAANVLKWGTGAINIQSCRIGNGEDKIGGGCTGVSKLHEGGITLRNPVDFSIGRWPANLIHDGSDEVLDAFPQAPGQQGDLKETGRDWPSSGRFGAMGPPHAHKARRDGEPSADRRYTEEGSTNFAALPGQRRFDAGSAARFFYCAKTSKAERELGCEDLTLVALAYGNQAQAEVKRGNTEHTGKSGINTVKMRGNNHPTVKPLALMQYLCRLVTPPGGVVLDPFTGSGSTGLAAMREGFDFIGIELNPDYIKIARARLLKEMLS